MEFGTLDGILGCVAVGLGCTLMPHWVVTNSRRFQGLEMVAIEPRLAVVPTVMVTHRDVIPLQALETLAETVSAQSPITE